MPSLIPIGVLVENDGKFQDNFFDLSSLLYLEAFLNEVHRFTSIVALGAPHGTLDDVEFRGYKIPKDTMIISNLFAAHRESGGVWGEEDPKKFHPERFLSPDRKSLIKYPNLIPFSTGKRICPGNCLIPKTLITIPIISKPSLKLCLIFHRVVNNLYFLIYFLDRQVKTLQGRAFSLA